MCGVARHNENHVAGVPYRSCRWTFEEIIFEVGHSVNVVEKWPLGTINVEIVDAVELKVVQSVEYVGKCVGREKGVEVKKCPSFEVVFKVYGVEFVFHGC